MHGSRRCCRNFSAAMALAFRDARLRWQKRGAPLRVVTAWCDEQAIACTVRHGKPSVVFATLRRRVRQRRSGGGTGIPG